MTTGTKAWELFRRPRGHRGAGRRRRCATWPTSSPTATRSRPVAIDSPDGRDILRHSTAHVMAQAVQDLFPDAKLGHRPADRERLLLRLRRRDPVRARGPREDRDPDAQDHQGEPALLAPAGLRRRRPRGAGRGALQARADRAQGVGAADAAEGASAEVGAGELTIYDNINRKGEVAWKDLCRGPHLPTTKRIPAFKLMRVGRGVLAGQREEQAAAAHLRHRLGEQGGARGAPPPHRGGRAARPPQARPRPRPVQLPRRDRLRAARSSTPRAG